MSLPRLSQLAIEVKHSGPAPCSLGGRGPQIDIDRRTGRPPIEAGEGDRAFRAADIGAVGEEMRVRGEIGALRGIALGVVDLLVARVGVDQDAHRAAQMLLAQIMRTAQIDERVGLAVKAVHLFARQAVPGIVKPAPIAPTLAKAEPFHNSRKIGDVIGAVRRHALDPRVVGRGTGVLDIPNLPAELCQADEVVHRLPRDPGERHLPGEMEEDDLAALGHKGTRIWDGSARITDEGRQNSAIKFRLARSRGSAARARRRVSRVTPFDATGRFPIVTSAGQRSAARANPERRRRPSRRADWLAPQFM